MNDSDLKLEVSR